MRAAFLFACMAILALAISATAAGCQAPSTSSAPRGPEERALYERVPATDAVPASPAIVVVPADAPSPGAAPHRDAPSTDSLTPGPLATRAPSPPEPSVAGPVPSPSQVSASVDTERAVIRPQTGRACRIHLRRDAMGLTALAPLPLQTPSPSARAVQLDGVIEQSTAEWIVLRIIDRTYWIRTDVVLAIEYNDGR